MLVTLLRADRCLYFTALAGPVALSAYHANWTLLGLAVVVMDWSCSAERLVAFSYLGTFFVPMSTVASVTFLLVSSQDFFNHFGCITVNKVQLSMCGNLFFFVSFSLVYRRSHERKHHRSEDSVFLNSHVSSKIDCHYSCVNAPVEQT